MKKKVCIFGDSIVRGTGDSTGGGRATRVRLHIEGNNPSIQVYPLGISGETTSDILKRFLVEATARKASVILLAIGVNDTKVNSEEKTTVVPVEVFAQNYQTLLEQSKVWTDKIICLSILPVDEARTIPFVTTSGRWMRCSLSYCGGYRA